MVVRRSDLPVGVSGIKLIEPVPDSGKVIVNAVRVNCVIMIIDSDIPDAMFGKGDVCEHSHHRRVYCELLG